MNTQLYDSDANLVYEVHVPHEAGSICVGCIYKTELGLFSLLLFGGEYSLVFSTLMDAMAFVRRRGQSWLYSDLSSCYFEAVNRIS